MIKVDRIGKTPVKYLTFSTSCSVNLRFPNKVNTI